MQDIDWNRSASEIWGEKGEEKKKALNGIDQKVVYNMGVARNCGDYFSFFFSFYETSTAKPTAYW